MGRHGIKGLVVAGGGKQSRLVEAQPGVPPEKNIQMFQSLATGCGTFWAKVRDYPFPTCLGSILCAFSRDMRARAAALV
jgi:hypothetical protein